MNKVGESGRNTTEWFAIKTRQDFKAEAQLTPLCEEVLLLKEKVNIPGKRARERAIIPRVVFIKTTRENALALERESHDHPEQLTSFWIYRYPKDNRIQVISESAIKVLRLLTAEDTTKCEIFSKSDFKENQHVRVIGGQFKGYEGYVQRVKKNKHLIVKIEGICLVMLPYIHPDLLEVID